MSTRYKVGETVRGHVGDDRLLGDNKVSRVGFLAGVFDLFHVGHLDVLGRAGQACDRLVVGVLTDDWALDAWGARPFVPLVERAQILEHLRCVDEVVVVDDVRSEWLTGVLGVQTVFAASGTDGVLGVDELDGIPGELVSVLPAGRGSRSPILRAAIDQRQSRSSVA
ncbi:MULTISPECIES: adenylyltransferase/cytidyltransferase family protein [unclassified Kribbella]|uniref:adenylyltransferase/cytidyltransferase family protein n=1 Tax=unclassified Kribbella TaxID=2644121 RepID=UPI0030789C96